MSAPVTIVANETKKVTMLSITKQSISQHEEDRYVLVTCSSEELAGGGMNKESQQPHELTLSAFSCPWQLTTCT